MEKIYLTSDWHFCHNREFLYKPRGFSSVEEMNEAIIARYNEVVGADDDVYCLGDVMLHDNLKGIECLKRLNGRIHIILGNHDTPMREELYKECENVVEVALAARFRYNGYHFFLTHYPCFTANLEKESLRRCTCNLYGHTHQKSNFYQDIPFMYHVGADSHDCAPVLIEQAIEDMKAKVEECKAQL